MRSNVSVKNSLIDLGHVFITTDSAGEQFICDRYVLWRAHLAPKKLANVASNLVDGAYKLTASGAAARLPGEPLSEGAIKKIIPSEWDRGDVAEVLPLVVDSDKKKKFRLYASRDRIFGINDQLDLRDYQVHTINNTSNSVVIADDGVLAGMTVPNTRVRELHGVGNAFNLIAKLG